jgi:hypothetical protein
MFTSPTQKPTYYFTLSLTIKGRKTYLGCHEKKEKKKTGRD